MQSVFQKDVNVQIENIYNIRDSLKHLGKEAGSYETFDVQALVDINFRTQKAELARMRSSHGRRLQSANPTSNGKGRRKNKRDQGGNKRADGLKTERPSMYGPLSQTNRGQASRASQATGPPPEPSPFLDFHQAASTSAPRGHWLQGDFLAEAIPSTQCGGMLSSAEAAAFSLGPQCAVPSSKYQLENFDSSHVAVEDGVNLKPNFSPIPQKHRALRPGYAS
jgi:hypothetical protein